jgi:cytochrome bd ubiquinol oxidase subunit II
MSADIWFAVVALGLVLYVTLDGYDLGIGILALTQRDDARRRSLLELVAPVWDGNESWILLIAVGLWGGFPAATGALLPAVYPAVIVMLFSLIGRGVSIEMISNSDAWPKPWGRVFMAGSLVAAFAQGTVIGAVVQGIPLGAGSRFTGGTFGFLSGYSVLTGLATVVLYALAGAAMVKMRSDDAALRAAFARWGRVLAPAAAGLVILAAALLPVAGAAGLSIGQPVRIALLTWAAAVAAVMFLAAWWSLGREDHDNLAFASVAIAMVAGIAGLAVLFYPLILPPDLTIARAASPSSSLDFLLAGFGPFIPLVIAYNAYAFLVLRPRRRAPAPASAQERSA